MSQPGEIHTLQGETECRNQIRVWGTTYSVVDSLGEHILGGIVSSMINLKHSFYSSGLALRQAISGQFLSLLDKVRSALQSHNVSMDRVRHFLIRYFQCDVWAKKLSDLCLLYTSDAADE